MANADMYLLECQTPHSLDTSTDNLSIQHRTTSTQRDDATVGSIIGWRIAQNSHTSVSVVCRSNWEAVKKAGYQLRTNTWGNGHFAPHQVLKSGSLADSHIDRPFDYCILANKVKDDYSSALADLRTLVSPQTTLVAAQNGMDVEVPLRNVFPNNTILSAVCNIGCSQVRPGVVTQTASIKRPAFLIGTYGQLKSIDLLRRDVLSAMDPEFGSVECVTQERWRKLVLNSAWNSTTALTGLNTHELLERPGAAELMYQIADEAAGVAAASGVVLDRDLPAQTVMLARNSLPITPSTLQDARSRRPMELSHIFGYLVSQAAKLGVHVPYLAWVYDLLQQQNSAFLGWDVSDSDQPSWREDSVSGFLNHEMSFSLPRPLY